MTTTPTLATYALRDGAGVPLVLLHGFPLDHRMWVATAQALPEGIRTIGVDLPGQGHSDVGGLPESLDDAAEAVYRTLRDQGEGNAVVAGLSMGGYVALALAERHPGFVHGIGLVDTKSTADSEEARANRLRIADEAVNDQTIAPVLSMPAKLLGPTSILERRNLFPAVEAWIRAQSPTGVAWAQRAMAARPDRTRVLEEYDGPVAVVVGAEDKITPLAEAEHMVHAARDATLTVVPNAGHMSAVEEPAAVAAALARLHRRVTHRA
ncbi:alpha/beta fold hydrolase [Isoptericola variabilis]|uniref:Alpha/beta hydrolase fold protein n=1 Tax=Isoptericola variabilis (strain 225) TaxID=743718 RepID=F6FR21_ISOV2|nr:alpha/beta fold hydrolase [Isoptericola variabilis]AEG44971.1 alpha/beta hydrolase fold protein [Isoptericola variabilis 225]TWH26017.1 pimeloyl-ACP methyl ester carboxylesterase [Isoptericola variabilis J7]